ncbi:hypothetical protein LF817_16555 [Halobacillus sp. A1]|uniref:hypothetical protein n=1 Tax=Halobacillus sp. A1 TaxID=2880262 RepID=UPI0020A68575|nr:hypothetical protein [Halobacillus sp. A1]MCP3032938.1 hypothetical protein [Halobacillus sp. A1]
MKKKPLCLVAFVYGSYTQYIPFYVYSILKSYPNYYVKIFVNKKLSKVENDCLEMIRDRLSSNFEIKENYFKEFDIDNLELSEEGKKAIRFLIPRKEFIDFENVYFGDIDILIVNELPSLLEGHLKHCEKTGLPYSNLVRKNSKRLTGLHFYKVKEYYDKMDEILDDYLMNKDKLVNQLLEYRWDEEFLFDIVNDGIGTKGLSGNDYRPHHGFHIGTIRHGKIEKGYLENGQNNVVHLLPNYPELKSKLAVYYRDPLFLDILERIQNLGIIKLSEIIIDRDTDQRLRKMQIRNKYRILKHNFTRARKKISKIINEKLFK